ncbi:MAG: hypothetical protein EZS28_016988, partial [Streblomastix strix]
MAYVSPFAPLIQAGTELICPFYEVTNQVENIMHNLIGMDFVEMLMIDLNFTMVFAIDCSSAAVEYGFTDASFSSLIFGLKKVYKNQKSSKGLFDATNIRGCTIAFSSRIHIFRIQKVSSQPRLKDSSSYKYSVHVCTDPYETQPPVQIQSYPIIGECIDTIRIVLSSIPAMFAPIYPITDQRKGLSIKTAALTNVFISLETGTGNKQSQSASTNIPSGTFVQQVPYQQSSSSSSESQQFPPPSFSPVKSVVDKKGGDELFCSAIDEDKAFLVEFTIEKDLIEQGKESGSNQGYKGNSGLLKSNVFIQIAIRYNSLYYILLGIIRAPKILGPSVHSYLVKCKKNDLLCYETKLFIEYQCKCEIGEEGERTKYQKVDDLKGDPLSEKK